MIIPTRRVSGFYGYRYRTNQQLYTDVHVRLRDTRSSSSSKDWNFNEASIDSLVDLPYSIQRYQDSLQYARSQLNFVVGDGLYLLPFDINLRFGFSLILYIN